MSEEGERKQQELLNPRGKPTREKTAGICWHQNRGEADLTHWMEDRGMASSSRLELEPNHHKEFNPWKLEPWSMEGWEKAMAGRKPSVIRGTQGTYSEWSQPQVVKKPVFLRTRGHRPVFMQLCVSNLQYLHDQWNPSLRSQLRVCLGCLQL